MNTPQIPPFRRVTFVDQPELTGARWWQDGLRETVNRRAWLLGVGMAGGAVALAGIVGAVVSNQQDAPRPSLDVQREQGWDVGKTSSALQFPGATNAQIPEATLMGLAQSLSPLQSAWQPYYVPTLFQVLSPPSSANLRSAIRACHTDAMDVAFDRGQGIASLFPQGAQDTAVFVDLPGPESVAMAAGMARRFDPVYLFDNWPHPSGVVASHLTLAAALYYVEFLKSAAQMRRVPCAPVFVIDSARLNPYANQTDQFDNRYMAKLPPADRLWELGVRHVLYVTPNVERTLELDDLNDDFVLEAAKGIEVKLTAASDFGSASSQTCYASPQAPCRPPPGVDTTLRSAEGSVRPPHYYGSSPSTHLAFWRRYRWYEDMPGVASSVLPAVGSSGWLYRPIRRATPFASMSQAGVGGVRPPPSGFGYSHTWHSGGGSYGRSSGGSYG